MKNKDLKHGDFSALAKDYSKYRPHYSHSVLNTIVKLMDRPSNDLTMVDVGAGTGIWTRMLAETGCSNVVAVEPNDNMRECGQEDSSGFNIRWIEGHGAHTKLPENTADLVTMASAFHWVDFDQATKEFARILVPNGRFAALWNPRLLIANPLLVEIEETLHEMAPMIERVSSGCSGFTENLMDRLQNSPYFTDVLFIEGRHVQRQTPEEYIGVWRSVNDIQVQAGSKIFEKFIAYVEKRVRHLDHVEATYQTRAWTAVKS